MNEPYREMATVPDQSKKPIFGLILKPKPPKVKAPKSHQCKTPSFWFVWNAIDGSVWRCKCGVVWAIDFGRWELSSLEKWEEAGGRVR